MRKMPTLGPPPKKSPLPRVILFAVVVGGIAGGVYWWRTRKPATPELAPQVAVVSDTASPAVAAVPTAPAPAEPQRAGPKAVTLSINGPLETAVVGAAGPVTGPALTQVVTRTLVWWVKVPSEILRGDTLQVVYEERTDDEPLVHAVRYESRKLDKTFEAYLFKAGGEDYARFYQPDGTELELRLKDTPIDTYEQITSLLRDGRRHKGVDFKTPVGTPVKATFDGTVTRRNWNFRGNGNSLEIAGPGGMKAIYLHLDELPKDIRVGTRIHKGQVIASSGNSGHSFAPHLHYQLMLGDEKVLDPFDRAPTWRRSLPEADRAAFDGEVSRMRTLLSSSVAGK